MDEPLCPCREESMRRAYCIGLGVVLGLGMLVMGGTSHAQTVGRRSCIGIDACTNNTGDVGTKSCNGESACENNSGRILNQACLGDFACDGNSGRVLNQSCLGI